MGELGIKSLPPAQILTSCWKPHLKARTEPRLLSTPLQAPTALPQRRISAGRLATHTNLPLGR